MLKIDVRLQAVLSLFRPTAFSAPEILSDLRHFLGAFFKGLCCVGLRLSHAQS